MKFNLRKARWIGELIAVYILVNGLNFIFWKDNPGFLSLPLSPYWLPILLFASRYGFWAGFFSALLSSLHYVFFVYGGIPGALELEKMMEAGTLVHPMAFLSIGMILGGMGQARQEQVKTMRHELIQTREAADRMKEWLDSNEKVRHTLEARIVGQATGMRALYEAAERFSSLNLQEIYEEALRLLQTHFQVETASIYLRENGFYVLKASAGWESMKQVEAKIPVGQSLMDAVFSRKRLTTIKDILAWEESSQYMNHYGEVLAMVPLRNSRGEIQGSINIEKMSFFSFNQANLELIELAVDWVNREIEEVRIFQELKNQKIHDKNYGIYTFGYFEQRLLQEFERAKAFDQKFNIAILKIEQYGFLSTDSQSLLGKSLASLLKHHLPSTVDIFHYRFDGTFALLDPCRGIQDVERDLMHVAKEFTSLSGKLDYRAASYHPDVSRAEDLLTPMLRECRLL